MNSIYLFYILWLLLLSCKWSHHSKPHPLSGQGVGMHENSFEKCEEQLTVGYRVNLRFQLKTKDKTKTKRSRCIQCLNKICIIHYSWSVGIQKYSTTFLLLRSGAESGRCPTKAGSSSKWLGPGSPPTYGAETLNMVLRKDELNHGLMFTHSGSNP